MIYIKKRAEYLLKIRKYFDDLDVMEVDTPLAYDYAVTDPFIDVFSIETSSGKKYLQSSPEYAMKRLLSKGSGSIYQICKAFRDETCGKNHNHEFTMIEWYRVGLDYKSLMQEMKGLFVVLKHDVEFIYLSYQELFVKCYGFNPHSIDLPSIREIVKNTVGTIQGLDNPTIADCLDILFSYGIEKTLNNPKTVYFIYDYTIHQAALARKITNDNGTSVAARFEVFYDGVELANGYYELLDEEEYLDRFHEDRVVRRSQNKKDIQIDMELIDSLESIPECSGVALGLDRLLMSFEGIKNIKDLSIF
jgi:lysyl-tRNA synthetase class 2